MNEAMDTLMDIGVIGLGAMGRAMAANLVAAGHRVTTWTRTGDSVPGAVAVATPVEAMQGDALLTMLPDDAALHSVLLAPGWLGRARPGLVHVVSATISVALSRELVGMHQRHGIGYVAAPVLGRPDVAASAQLNVLAAGEPTAVRRVAPLLSAISRKVWPMGEDPPAANAAKIACNMMITMAIEAMAEAVVLTEANGLHRDRFFDLILNTLFGSRSYQVYASHIAEERYEAGFKASLGLKDLRLAREAADVAGRDLPLLEAVAGQMARTVEAGFGAKDWSAMAGFTLRSPGLSA
ncbi:3-hydroxyisobutyrate dehydrogenase [Roseateles sp. YR242]|uniref:NAD(P)-dependent oxidoreductase n=1 Tax=Roseateles sp. YR242 TaxID=1855305 RepID=UPI0008BB7E55|nr:NAD(P)-dependent oxidoreductase [Roseateles sp. YR242]SEK82068.1 3-hydroxyisobutyrate dehydrogenase [Roseateles sp. YR242]